MEKEQLIELVKKSQSGDQNAIEKLLQYAHTSVSYQCRKMLKNEQDAEDMTQEVLVTIYTKLDTLQDPAAFWKWANQITATRCINALNRTHVEYQFAEDEDGHSILDNLEDLDEQVIPDKVIDNTETARMIEEIVEGLPDAQRAATLMFYYDEMSVKEIALTMKVSENTIKSRLNYARKAIKEKVLDYEKQGVKLYGLSPLPFLLYFLRLLAQQQADEEAAGIMVAEVMAGGTAAGVAGAAAAGAGSAAAAAGGSVAAAAGSTTATGIFAGISAKVVAGVLAAVVTIGSVVAGVIPNTQGGSTEPATVPTESTSVMETESIPETEAPTTEVTTVSVETEPTEVTTEPAATEPVQAPTEETSGSDTFEYPTCSACGIGQVIPVNLTQDPCATRLEVAFQCSHCGTIEGYSYPPGNGHTYGISEDGQYEICTVCGEILGPTDIGHGGVTDETEHIHSYDSVVTEPTCTSGGYTTYTCSCGASYKANETPASHAYTSEITTPPTCSYGGEATYTCSCGASYTEAVPKNEHVWSEWEVTLEPTTTTYGKKVRTCELCNGAQEVSIDPLPADETEPTDEHS